MLSEKPDCLMNMTGARNIASRYQRQSASDAICPGQPWPEEVASACARHLCSQCPTLWRKAFAPGAGTRGPN